MLHSGALREMLEITVGHQHGYLAQRQPGGQVQNSLDGVDELTTLQYAYGFAATILVSEMMRYLLGM